MKALALFLTAIFLSPAVNAGPLLSPEVLSLSAGYDYSCALARNGDRNSTICWGLGFSGLDAVTGLRNAELFVGGYAQACAVVEGALYCSNWSENGKFRGVTLAAVDYGNYFCFADAVNVKCWEDFPSGGRGFHQGIPEIKDPTALAVGFDFGCALAQGKVTCWTYLDDRFHITKVPPLKNPRELAAAEGRACVLDDTGVVCWGYRGPDWKMPALANPKSLQVDANYNCVLDGGELKCWSHEGQLLPGRKNVRAYAHNILHDCALDDNGVQCWGEGKSGQLKPPAQRFGLPTMESPQFSLDNLSRFFGLVASATNPARAKFFAGLSRYLDRDLPASNRSAEASLDRYLMGALVMPAIEHVDAKFVREKLAPAFREQIEAFGRELKAKVDNGNTKAPIYHLGRPPVALTVARLALEGMRDFMTPEAFAPLAPILRDIGTAMADPDNAAKRYAVSEDICQNGRLLDRLLEDPKLGFFAAALWATTWNF